MTRPNKGVEMLEDFVSEINGYVRVYVNLLYSKVSQTETSETELRTHHLGEEIGTHLRWQPQNREPWWINKGLPPKSDHLWKLYPRPSQPRKGVMTIRVRDSLRTSVQWYLVRGCFRCWNPKPTIRQTKPPKNHHSNQWGPSQAPFFNLGCPRLHGDGSKPWYLVNPKIAGKWMFIPLKMVCIGIDP